MTFMQTLFLFFLIVPFVEIYLLLAVGSVIGVLPTVFLVVTTAIIGARLLRSQGFDTWRRFREQLEQGAIPAYELVEGPLLLVGGALLLTPGFFTDLLGFACLIPTLRRKIAHFLLENYFLRGKTVAEFRAGTKFSDNVIDGEYRRKDDESR